MHTCQGRLHANAPSVLSCTNTTHNVGLSSKQMAVSKGPGPAQSREGKAPDRHPGLIPTQAPNAELPDLASDQEPDTLWPQRSPGVPGSPSDPGVLLRRVRVCREAAECGAGSRAHGGVSCWAVHTCQPPAALHSAMPDMTSFRRNARPSAHPGDC